MHPFESISVPSNNDFKNTFPLDSLDSKRLIGYIFSRDIRPVPVWCVYTFFEVGPVRIKCPFPLCTSQYVLTASQILEASCHSSTSLGLAPSSKALGLIAAVLIKSSFFGSFWNWIQLLVYFFAVVVLPHHFGPTIFIAPNARSFSSRLLSIIRGK